MEETLLTKTFAHIRAQAERSGMRRDVILKHGARMVVEVRDGEVILSIGRPNKPLGAVEIPVFQRDCRVPATARRLPAEGQREIIKDGTTWHVVCWKWRTS